MTNDDDGLLIKPEPRKPGFLVAVGMAVLALLAVGYFAWGKFAGASPPSAAAEMAAHDAAAQAPPVVLAVNAQGQYFVGTTQVPESDLLPTLKALAEKDAQTTILIRADKNIPYAKVAQLLLASQGAGLEKVSIDTQATGQ